MSTATQTARGLESVVLTSTALSRIDGEAGKLSYAGYDSRALAENASFEEICYLLWHGKLPAVGELRDFRAALAHEQKLTEREQALVQAVPTEGHGMDALRTLVSGLAQLDPQGAEPGHGQAEVVGLRLLAKMPVLIAAWDRRRRGLEPVAADPQLGYAANVLWMLQGKLPSETAARAFNTYLVLLAEHGLNASTFAARVAISAYADIYGAIVAAIATLKGLWHGGANQKAMETFLAIGEPEQAEEYISGLIARRERLMGIGHRIYKVEDPRVPHLRAQAEALAAESEGRWQAIADTVRQIVAEHPYYVERRLNPNVEFYSAPLLYTLGIPLDLFTAAFAISRMAGWIAHIREQIADNRIIRPKADYSGPEAREWVALEERV